MSRGGKRPGAGAPKGNTNALKHGGRAKVLFGIPLTMQLSRFEYRALCFEQLEEIKLRDENLVGAISTDYVAHKKRYQGAIEFSDRIRKKYSSKQFITRTVNGYLKTYQLL